MIVINGYNSDGKFEVSAIDNAELENYNAMVERSRDLWKDLHEKNPTIPYLQVFASQNGKTIFNRDNFAKPYEIK